MTVRVTTPFLFPGGAPAPTRFTDTFNRASSANLGPNWFSGALPRTPIVNPIICIQPNIAAITGPIQGLSNTIFVSGNPATLYVSQALALPLCHSKVNGRNQFAEMTLVFKGVTGAQDIDMGPAVSQTMNRYYSFIVRASNGLWALNKMLDGTLTNLAFSGPGVVVAGDVMRIEITYGVASNTLVCKLNGVIVTTTVDAAAPLTEGYPGFNNSASSSGGVPTCEWKNFVGGIL